MNVKELINRLAILCATRDTIKTLSGVDDGFEAEERDIFIILDGESYEIDVIDGDETSIYIRVVE